MTYFPIVLSLYFFPHLCAVYRGYKNASLLNECEL